MKQTQIIWLSDKLFVGVQHMQHNCALLNIFSDLGTRNVPQHLQEQCGQKKLVFSLLISVLLGLVLCFGAFPGQEGCFETGKVNWRLRKMIVVSDHMTCEERLRELSLCSQVKRVRGGTVTVCDNLKKTATKVMVPNSSQEYQMMW